MKIMTILGTRPEIIRLSRIIPKLDRYCDHVLVHTGQNFEDSLSSVFFRDLDLRQPDHHLGVESADPGEQIGRILAEVGRLLSIEKPDAVLILGDTNSGLVSIIANRMGIPVFHLEAGNRCFDDRVPEEINRRVIDHTSKVLLAYTDRSKANLIREGIPSKRIYVVGNPILEVQRHYEDQVSDSTILKRLDVLEGGFFLATMHRAENVDSEERLRNIVVALDGLQREYSMPIVCSLHPRTRDRMQDFGLSLDNERILTLEPLGFFDFVKLEKHAFCVLTDSGTVQEECCLFGVPNVTIRDATERPETIDCGSNILSGVDPDVIRNCVSIVLNESREWKPPVEYLEEHVSDKTVRIVLSHLWQGYKAALP